MAFPTYVSANEEILYNHITEILDQLTGVTSVAMTLAGLIGVSGTLTLSATGLVIAQISTPSAPGASKSIIYPKSDGLWYMRSGAAGAEQQVPVGITTSIGDMLYATTGGVSFARLQLGSVNNFLISNGTIPAYSANPVLLPLDPPAANALTRDSIAKGWAFLTWNAGVPTTAADYNVSSYTDSGTGDVGVNWDTDFASGNYAVVATPYSSTGAALAASQGGSAPAAGSVRLYIFTTTTGALVDPSGLHVAAFGAQ